jgi:hypothetical protein
MTLEKKVAPIGGFAVDASPTNVSYMQNIIALITFMVITVLANPFAYGQAEIAYSSSLYYVPVLQRIDPDLFTRDEVVDSLARFDTLYYRVLSIGSQLFNVKAADLEWVLFSLYVLSRLSLVVLIFFLSRVFSDDFRLFVLLASSFVLFQPPSLLSATSPFDSVMDHGWVAYLLGLFATLSLFRRWYLAFWLALCFAVLSHPLVGLHLVLCAVPPLVFTRALSKQYLVAGILLLGATTLMYVFFMAPPPMSSEASQMLVQSKRSYSNVTPFVQSPVMWANATVTAFLVYFAYHQLLPKSTNSKLLFGFLLSGIGFGLAVSLAVELIPHVRLVQFQPARIFVWVTLFAQVILGIATFVALKAGKPIGVILLATLVFTGLGSSWAILFRLLALAYFLLHHLSNSLALIRRWFNEQRVDLLLRVGSTVLGIGVFAGWIISQRVPFESWSDPLALVPALAVLVGINIPPKLFYDHWRWRAIGLLIIYLIVVVSTRQIASYQDRVDPDWDQIRHWAQEHTAKEDRFITAPTQQVHFRNLALRTTVDEPVGSLIWVDSLVHMQNQATAQQSRQAFDGAIWHTETLFQLASEQDAQFVILKGDYIPGEVQPVFQSGKYSLFAVPKE